jgi:hypothetical protein
MSADRFFAYARARHEITLKRATGLPRPWTSDPILDTYRFTNVFREMDRTTEWIAKHVRGPLDQMLERGEIEPWQQALGIILAREFNRVSTLEQIFCQDRIDGTMEPVALAYIRGGAGAPSIEEFESYMRMFCPQPWVTGAYIIKTPDGMDKLAGALWMVERARERLPTLAADGAFACSMESLHADLASLPYLGQFTAYEVVTDLRWMGIGREWPDIMSWAAAGPGAIRGLHRLHGRFGWRRKAWGGPALSQSQALAEMRELLRMAHSNLFLWPTDDQDWPEWELREVEHTLCEWDKYERVRLGQGKPRGVYR